MSANKPTYQLEFKDVAGDGACFYRAVYAYALHYNFVNTLFKIIDLDGNNKTKSHETEWVIAIKTYIADAVLDENKNILIYEFAQIYFLRIFEFYPINAYDISVLFNYNSQLKDDTWFYDMLPDWIKSSYNNKAQFASLFNNRDNFLKIIKPLCADRIRDIKVYAMQFDVSLMQLLLENHDITLFVSSTPSETIEDMRKYTNAENTKKLYLPDENNIFNILLDENVELKATESEQPEQSGKSDSNTNKGHIKIILIIYNSEKRQFYLPNLDYLTYDSNTKLILTNDTETFFYYDFGIINNYHILFVKFNTLIKYIKYKEAKVYKVVSNVTSGSKQNLTQLFKDDVFNTIGITNSQKESIKEIIKDITQNMDLESYESYKNYMESKTKLKESITSKTEVPVSPALTLTSSNPVPVVAVQSQNRLNCKINGGNNSNICIYVKLTGYKYKDENGEEHIVRGNHYNYIIFNKLIAVGGRNKKNQREKIFMYGKFYTKYYDKEKKKYYIRRNGMRKYLPNPKKINNKPTKITKTNKPMKPTKSRTPTKSPKVMKRNKQSTTTIRPNKNKNKPKNN
jgi:hypothetical protein